MKIAVFQCDHIPEERQHHIGGNYDQVYMKLLKTYFPDSKISIFDVTNNQYPKDLSQFDIYFITGSIASVYDDEQWIHTLSEKVKDLFNSKRIVVGICFGHQIIAHALGGEVKPSINGWAVGIQTFHLTYKPDWLKSDHIEFNLIMSCQDQVHSVPKGSQVIAENHFCPVGIYQVSNHFLGIQAHPDWTKEYSHATMISRKDRIPEQVINNGIKSLDLDVHQDEVMFLVKSFIESQK